MKWTVYFILLTIFTIADVYGQSKNESTQYAFVMVINREGTQFYFSPVFRFRVDKRGRPVCDLAVIETTYRGKVANEKFDVLTSEYFDTKEEAERARRTYIDSEKKAGHIVAESTIEVPCH